MNFCQNVNEIAAPGLAVFHSFIQRAVCAAARVIRVVIDRSRNRTVMSVPTRNFGQLRKLLSYRRLTTKLSRIIPYLAIYKLAFHKIGAPLDSISLLNS